MKKTVLVVGLLLLGLPWAGADPIQVTPLPEPQVAAEDAPPAAAESAVLPVGPEAPIALATNCYPAYQACRNSCGGNTTCLANCWDAYNACRLY